MKMEEVHHTIYPHIIIPPGSIGVEELEEPLIALGLVQSREEVEALMKNVDDDGEIIFEEFLNLVSSSKGGTSSNLI
jgi:Ca2+-binding EF-hand superfamily protein